MKRTDEHAPPPWGPEAFAQVYDRYLPRVYGYVAARVNRKQDVEDLVSEAFLRVVRERQRFEPRHAGAFDAWLFRIAHNLVVDFYRRDRAQPSLLSLDQASGLQAPTQPPEDAVAQAETLARLRQLIARLPARQQEVVTLKFFGQLRNQAIAEVLGLDERTVASHLCRGLRQLHEHFTAEGGPRPAWSTADERAD